MTLLLILLGIAITACLTILDYFVQSPIQYLLDYLDNVTVLPEIVGHILWFFPLDRIIIMFGYWLVCFGTTALLMFILKLVKLK